MAGTKIEKLMELKKTAAPPIQRSVAEAFQNFKPKEALKAVGPTMGLLGLFALMDRAIIPAGRQMFESAREPIAWKKLLKRDPSLAEDPLMREHFKAIHAMAPKMMDYPSFSLPVLQRAREYGTPGIPIDLALNISKVAPVTSSLTSPASMAFANRILDAGAQTVTQTELPEPPVQPTGSREYGPDQRDPDKMVLRSIKENTYR